MIFSWLSPIPWTSDADDLPQWADPPERFDLLQQPGPQMVWEHAPAAVVPPSVYRTDIPRRYVIRQGCNGGFVWGSLLRQIERRGAVEPWQGEKRRRRAA